MKAAYKKILCLILSAVMIIVALPALEPVSQAAAEKITSNDGKWIMYDQQEDNEAWLYRYSGDETDIVIPGEIDGYKITGISSECFTGAKAAGIYDADNWENNDKIKSITIPSTVETIDKRAFFHMDSLEEVVFDGHMTGNLRVNNDAFKFCMSLESLKFPKYCNPEFYDFLSRAYVTRLEVPCVNANQTSGSLSYSYDLHTVENLTITGDYTFGVLRSFLCTDSLKTVEIMGFVTGDNVSRDLCKSNGSALNKPDIILHNIPSAAVDEGLIELGYHKIFDPDTGIITYTVEGTPDKSYSPVLNDLGNFDPIMVGDFGYVLTYSGNAVITNYWGSGESISFPSEMHGYRVTAIGADGFPIDTGDAETITIPDTVEYIAKSAFEGNSALQHVDFPDSLKIIEARAFKDCSLKEVILPGVVYAGAGAFENCLPDKIFIPSSLRRIPERMFFEDIGSTSSRLTEVTISEGVRSIGPDAFNYKYDHKDYGNRFTLSLPSSVEQIGARAFYYAGILGDLVLPAGINILSEEAFAYNRLSSVTLPENLEKIEKRALSGNRYTESIIIPAKVFYLGEYAFSSLTVPELVINAVIRNIPKYCFYYLTAEKLVIPEGAEQIGIYAFKGANLGVLDLPASLIKAQSPLIYDSRIDTLIYRCKNLNSGGALLNKTSKIGKLIIKDTVRELGDNIFEHAVITGEIDMEPGVEKIGYAAFSDLSANEIIIPDTVKTILEEAFAFSELKYVRIPESVTLLGEAAFYGNELLERVDYLPSSCVLDMSLGYGVYTFENCPNLKQFNFGDKIKYIPDNLLRKARGVETVTIPDCVTDIGSYSFADTGLKSIVMPDSLESIGDGCFENCSELESVVINGKVFLIGDNTFSGCNKLREIYIADSVKNIGRNSFSGCESLETVYMSRNVVYIPEECFKNCTALTSFTWESESKLIGKLAFAGCTSLTVFNFAGIEKLFPNSFEGSGVGVVSLGEAVDEFEAAELQVVELQCFRYCASLQTVALGGNVNTVQSLAFADCENLETAIIADSVEVIFPDAFANCPKLTIYCNEDSYAYNYAVENNIPVSTFVVEPIPSQRYTGKDIEPPVNVSLSGNQLSKGVDFKVRYSDNTDVGTAVVKVSGINTYKMFTSVVNFSILTRDISEAGIESISDRKYTGSEITPVLTVKYNGKTLRKGVDYNVIYTNNISVGTAKATLTGIGNFSGTASAEFNITESKTDPAITPPWHNPSEDPDDPTVPVIIPPWNDTPDDPDDPVTPPSADPGTPQGDGTPSDSSDGSSLLMRIFSFVLSFARTLFSLIRSLISQIRSTAD